MTKITNNVKLIETDSQFLENVSSRISTSSGDFYYMPFWYKKVSKNVYQEVRFIDLPIDVQDIIIKHRESVLKIK